MLIVFRLQDSIRHLSGIRIRDITPTIRGHLHQMNLHNLRYVQHIRSLIKRGTLLDIFQVIQYTIQILPVRILYTRTEIIAGLVDISHLRSISAESHRLIHCEPPIIQTIGCVI